MVKDTRLEPLSPFYLHLSRQECPPKSGRFLMDLQIYFYQLKIWRNILLIKLYVLSEKNQYEYSKFIGACKVYETKGIKQI